MGKLITNHAEARMYPTPRAVKTSMVADDRIVACTLSREMMSTKIAAWNAKERWKVMKMIMTIVAARTIRTTKAVRPGYGASSSLRNWPNQDRKFLESGIVFAAAAMFNFREW